MTEDLEIVELRDAQPSDLPFLFSLYCDVRAPELAAWGWPAAQQDAFLRMQFEAQRQSFLAAYPESNHSIVSVAGVPMGRRLVARTSDGLHLVDIALLAAYRNRGIGTRLIEELFDNCSRSECALNLNVLRGNPAMRLYQRLGFQEIGADAMYIQMSWKRGTRRPA
jgi:ribosomal protein S18 acetylase RimI-like enzyme